jgi:hypothetical protein
MKQSLKFATLGALLAFTLTSCPEHSDVVSQNISTAAHNFEVNRRAIFYNGITGDYILTIEGLITLTESNGRLEVTCKTGPSTYKKHYLGLSDNVTYFMEQLEPVEADPFHYRVVFRPATIIPDIDVQTR